MDIWLFLQSHWTITLIIVTCLGLIVGSFFNVVIYRYPIMLKQQWRNECEAFLADREPKPIEPPFNLAAPRSRCTHCKQPIKPWHNIPLISYLFLRGKCAHCKTRISPLYFIVELLSALLALFVCFRFGLNAPAATLIIFSWGLLVLSLIDWQHQLLPDVITLSLLWVGLLANLNNYFTSINQAVLGAIFGYLFLWAIAKIFFLVRKKEGMGFGDFKMFAMLGAWLGLGALLNVILTAVVIALIVSLTLIFAKRIKRENPIPFGPFLALGGWLTLMFGQTIVNWINYLLVPS